MIASKITKINNIYENIYLFQQNAIESLSNDLKDADSEDLLDSMIQAAAEAALGNSLSRLGKYLGKAASAALGRIISSRAMRQDDPVAGHSAEEPAAPAAADIHSNVEKLTIASAEWVVKRVETRVRPAVQGAVTLGASSKTGAKSINRFIQAQKVAVLTLKQGAEDHFHDILLPALSDLSHEEFETFADGFMDALKGVPESMLHYQYLASLSEWIRLSRPSPGPAVEIDLSQGAFGALRVAFTADSPSGILRLTGGSIGGVQQSVVARINEFSDVALSALPIPKVYVSTFLPPVVLTVPAGASCVMSPEDIRIGHEWLVRHEKERDGRNASAFGAAIAVTMDLGQRTVKDLGKIEQASAGW